MTASMDSLRGGIVRGLALGVLCLAGAGCATPNIRRPSGTRILSPDEADNMGGSFIESTDIRTVATKMSGSLLQVPEIVNGPQPVRIAIAPIRNSTRHIIDKDIFTKRLRIELGRYARGRVRFFSQGMGQNVRRTIMAEQDEDRWSGMIEQVADTIVGSTVVQGATEPVRVAVIPVRNTNLVNMNADSLTALIRAKIAEKANGKVVFLARDKSGKAYGELLAEVDLKNLGVVLKRKDGEIKVAGVDYFLGGEFISAALGAQVNKPATTTTVGRSQDDPGVAQVTRTTGTKKPNVTKYLNVMFVEANTGETPIEKLVTVERKMKTGLSRANFILTGELSALSKASAGGDRSDYVIMSFQLVDPQSNEVIWEDAYETKKATNRSVLYK